MKPIRGKEFRLSSKAIEKLQLFENGLNPVDPEGGPFSANILGYGEMSTVFGFGDEDLAGLAFKRMAVFRNEDELIPYEKNFRDYSALLNDVGLQTPDYGLQRVSRHGQPVLYIFQRMVDPERIGHRFVQKAQATESVAFFHAILGRLDLVFRHNAKHPDAAIGLDGQISNWALRGDQLLYLDTSTPLMRKDGMEQLDPELFLRICPSYLVWVIRLFFLADVMNRYYDLRLVIIDIIANLYKEQVPDLIPAFLETANAFLRLRYPDLKPIDKREVDAYYKEDAWIWRIFLAFRRLERYVRTKLLKKEYDLILPGPIQR